MTAFVLVHGAWHGGWCWSRVRKRLQAAGHEVFTPTLSGLADRWHLRAPGVDLETHIRDVAGLIQWEDLTDVVLCGHSYGGCVVTAVADRIPHHIAHLVYLDAFFLDDGQCLHDVLPPRLRDLQMEGAARQGSGWLVPPIRAEVYNVNAGDRAWADRQYTPQPIATFRQRIRLTGGHERLTKTYIYATRYPQSPFGPFFERAKDRRWRTRTVAAGHDAMLDQPAEVARLLTEAGA